MLAMQGVSWLKRRAIAWATITLHVKEYADDAAVTHIDIAQTATGGVQGTAEIRTLDWTEREHEDHVFGKLVGKSRWVDATPDNVADAFLRDGWEKAADGPGGEAHIESFVENKDKGWTARQIWGFAVVDGKRYYVRRVVAEKGEEVIKVRLVYDWQG